MTCGIARTALILCLSSVACSIDTLGRAYDGGPPTCASGDTQCDPANCGQVGHDCLDGACVDGVCQPVVLLEVESSALDPGYVQYVGQDQFYLYFFQGTNH